MKPRPKIREVKLLLRQPPRPFSAVRLPTFYGCQCDPSLLQGDRALEMLDKLGKVCRESGFTVIGEHFDLYGDNWEQKADSGWTLSYSFTQSGMSADAWHDAWPPNGTIDWNIHWCDGDTKARGPSKCALIEEKLIALAIDLFEPLEVELPKRIYRRLSLPK